MSSTKRTVCSRASKTEGATECAKPRRRVMLRVDAGREIGFGHLVRSSALAAYLSDDFECVMASRNADTGLASDYMQSIAAEAGVTLLPLFGKNREEFDDAFLEMLHPEDIVVLDNYFFETEYQIEVKRRCGSLVCIDDMHNRHLVGDLVMTFCPLERKHFSMHPDARFVGGIEWSFLRKPFLRPRHEREVSQLAPRRVVLAMGGADPMKLTGVFVRLARQINPDLEMDILAGQTVEIDFEEDKRTRVHRQASACEVADILDSCDLGIFPASTICVEGLSRGLPVAAGFYVDNQLDFYKYGVDREWFAPLGCLTRKGSKILKDLTAVLTSPVKPAPLIDFNARRHDIIGLFKELG